MSFSFIDLIYYFHLTIEFYDRVQKSEFLFIISHFGVKSNEVILYNHTLIDLVLE